MASCNYKPSAPVLATFSLPAKSTKYNLPTLVDKSISFYLNSKINNICDLLDPSFILVTPTALLFPPYIINNSISYSSDTYYSVKSYI